LKSKPYISVVIPVYKCEKCLVELCKRLKQALGKLNKEFEIIFINDASPDNAWQVITELGEKDKRVTGICLSRNFGQHYAIAAGLERVSGEWIVVMDCDLQDQPEEIINLHQKAMEGYDIVLAQRINRKDIWFKKIISKIFYKVLGYLTKTKQDSKVANFGVFNKKVIQVILNMKDSIRYFPTMVRWVGFKTIQISVSHAPRENGSSSYTIRMMLKLGINTVLSFSEKPLVLVAIFGLIISAFSFIIGIVYIIKYFLGDIEVLGFATIIISISFLSGMIILVLGIIGLYIGKIFENVKNRPTYIISESINLKKENNE